MSEDIYKKLNIPRDCEKLVCAVSGGADSVCMLHLCLRASRERGFELYAAHYEHGIRGEESLKDAEFVERLCNELGVRLYTEHGNVPLYAHEKRLGLEEAARELRYAFLEKTAKAVGGAYIATAHNAGDNAETMLFNLTRGSGGAGLRGIPPRRGNIIRPLLSVTRAEIEAYLTDNSLSHVEDGTNASDEYTRNLLRHEVMPVLRRINPNVEAAFGRAAALLERDEDYMQSVARRFIDESCDGESVSAESLAALPPALSSRVVRLMWPHALGAAHVEAVLALAGGGTERAYLDIPGGRVRREQGRIYFSEYAETRIAERALIPNEELVIPEAGLRVRAFYTCAGEGIYDLFKTYELKCENIYGNLFCGGKRPGDRMFLARRGCTKSLKSLFAERHMTGGERDRTVVIRDEKGVAAVVGFGVDGRLVPAAGDRVLRIEIDKI